MAHNVSSQEEPLSKSLEAAGHAVAGGIAGMAAITALYPLNTVSTRLQVQARKVAQAPGDASIRPYKGTLDAFERIITEEGYLALYSGLKASLIGIAASNTVYFYWYSFLKDLYTEHMGKPLTALQVLGVSSLSGVINVLVTLPIWVVNTKMQLDTTKSLKDQLQIVYNTDGVKGFYKGLIPSLILVSNPAVQYMVYEQVARFVSKLKIKRSGGNGKLTSLDVFLVGAVAKLVATLVTFPYLLVKSRLQAKGTEGVVKYAGFVDAVTRIFAQDGFFGFYKGISSKLVQTVLGAAFMFWVKEGVVVYTLLCIRALKRIGK